MKLRLICPSLLTLLLLGCNSEPETPREQAERAQEELEQTREDAAEMVAEAEEEAVETLADARDEARAEVQEAKRDAAQQVDAAERKLQGHLDRLSDRRVIEEEPDGLQQQSDTATLSEDQPPTEIRVQTDVERVRPENEE